MKLVERVCPHCAASISIKETDNVCVCSYCGSTFEIVKDNTDSIDKSTGNTNKKKKIAALLVTGAVVVSLSISGIPKLLMKSSNVKDNKPSVTQEEVAHNVTFAAETTTKDLSALDTSRIYLSSNVEPRAEYLSDAFKEYGIINSATNSYYTKEELIDIINYINGDSSLNNEESELMFENLLNHFLLDTINSEHYKKAVNKELDMPYNVHLAEAIISNKDNKLYPLLLHLDDIYRTILSSNDDTKNDMLKQEFKDIVNHLIAGDYVYNYEHYSIEDFNNKDSCFAQALLEEYVLNILPFSPDVELANYFNSFDENSYLNIMGENLINANTNKELTL